MHATGSGTTSSRAGAPTLGVGIPNDLRRGGHFRSYVLTVPHRLQKGGSPWARPGNAHTHLVPGAWAKFSDHLPITAVVYPEAPARLTQAVPTSVKKNPSICKKVLSCYNTDLPACRTEISACTSPVALEKASKRLAKAFL